MRKKQFSIYCPCRSFYEICKQQEMQKHKKRSPQKTSYLLLSSCFCIMCFLAWMHMSLQLSHTKALLTQQPRDVFHCFGICINASRVHCRHGTLVTPTVRRQQSRDFDGRFLSPRHVSSRHFLVASLSSVRHRDERSPDAGPRAASPVTCLVGEQLE